MGKWQGRFFRQHLSNEIPYFWSWKACKISRWGFCKKKLCKTYSLANLVDLVWPGRPWTSPPANWFILIRTMANEWVRKSFPYQPELLFKNFILELNWGHFILWQEKAHWVFNLDADILTEIRSKRSKGINWATVL